MHLDEHDMAGHTLGDDFLGFSIDVMDSQRGAGGVALSAHSATVNAALSQPVVQSGHAPSTNHHKLPSNMAAFDLASDTASTHDSHLLDAFLASIVASPAPESDPRRQHPTSASTASQQQRPSGNMSRSSSRSSSKSSRKRPLESTPSATGLGTDRFSLPQSRAPSAGSAPTDISPEAIQHALANLPLAAQQSLITTLLNSLNRTPDAEPGRDAPLVAQPPSHSVSVPSSSSHQVFPDHNKADGDQGNKTASSLGMASNYSLNEFVHPSSFSRQPAGWQQNQFWRSPTHESHDESLPTSPLTAVTPGSFATLRDAAALLTPGMSPDLTPLSAFSNASFSNSHSTGITSMDSSHAYNGTKMVQGMHPPDFFSPLTSPAIRPQGYVGHQTQVQSVPTSPAHVHALQPLIDQAASLGLSSPFPFSALVSHNPPTTPMGPPLTTEQMQMVHQLAWVEASRFYAHVASNPSLDSHAMPTMSELVPTNQVQLGVQSPHIFPIAERAQRDCTSVRSSPAHQPVATGSTRGRNARGARTRPSPRVRPSDPGRGSRASAALKGKGKEVVEGGDDSEGKGAKRAKNGALPTGGTLSLQTSPVVPPNFGQHELPAHLDYPVNGSSHQLSSGSVRVGLETNTPSPVDLDSTVPSSSKRNTVAVPTSRISAVKHICPVTPASIMNLGSTIGAFSGLSPNLTTMGGALTVASTRDSANVPDLSLPRVAGSVAGEGNSIDEAMPPVSETQSTTRPLRHILPATAAKPHYLDGRGKDFISTASREASMNEEVVPEHRKSSHKMAEQKRRDALRLCLDDMRRILPPIYWSEDDESERRPGEGNVGGQKSHVFDPLQPNKGVSKVALLRRSNEYMLTLHERIKKRDGALEVFHDVINKLQQLLPDPATRQSSHVEEDLVMVKEILVDIEQERVDDDEAKKKALEQQQQRQCAEGNGGGGVGSDDEEVEKSNNKKKKATTSHSKKKSSLTNVDQGTQVVVADEGTSRRRKKGVKA